MGWNDLTIFGRIPQSYSTTTNVLYFIVDLNYQHIIMITNIILAVPLVWQLIFKHLMSTLGIPQMYTFHLP